MRGYVSFSGRARSALCLALVLLMLAALLIRVLYIQTVDFDLYLDKVLDQMTTQSPTRAPRGNIYDRYGRVLATSVTTYRIFISPSAIAKEQRRADRAGIDICYAEHISRGLSQILSLDYDEILKHTTYTGYLDRTVMSGASDEIADGVRKFIEENSYHDMVFVEAGYSRYYPNGTLASSVIGFTSSDAKGVWGLEAYYDESLRGTDGYYITARDSFGNELPYEYESYIPAVSGASLQTTLDAYIQSALEEQLLEAVGESDAKNRACGIVVNVKTGAILAMATVPGYDLNDPRVLNAYYSDLLARDGYEQGSDEYRAAYSAYLLEMWRNKAVSDSYIPGSTFKILTSAMALSEGKVNIASDRVFCGGSLSVSGHTIHCHKTRGHGSLTFSEGLTQSCNVWFMTLGERIGTEAFYDRFGAFGYLEKTGIDLPGEGRGIIKTRNAMTSLDLAIYAFGQNFNVTPIQHIMAVAAVANGGYLLEPYIVESITDADGETLYSHEVQIKRQVVWFMTLGERIGTEAFYDRFGAFGYLEKTGIDLPGEGRGIIKTRNAMTSLDLAIYAFGQNFNVTPIQHIMAVAAVANGGYLLEPYIVESITDADGETLYSHEVQIKRQVVSTEVCRTLAGILESGVSGDGGAKNAYVAGYRIAAKTGTSEKKGNDFRVEGVEPYVCSCVAFAPSDEPEIAALIMVDEPSTGVLYGSVVAAPYVGALMDKILPYIGKERDESLICEVSTPDLVGMSATDAERLAHEGGFDVSIKGTGGTVVSQIPASGTVIDASNKKITLYTGDATPSADATVPSLVGLSAYEANRALTCAGFNVRIVGATNGMIGAGATVIEQSAPPGTVLPSGSVITVRLRYLDPDE